jgi:hypothetical protein
VISVTRGEFPFIVLARREVEMDSGGHLIGTVYPGERIDMNEFIVPEPRWSSEQLCKVETALLWVYAVLGHEAFNTFCCGEQTEMDQMIADNREAVSKMRVPADLEMAHKFLDDYFNQWSE